MHDCCTLTNNIITSSHLVYINQTVIQTIAPLLIIPGLHYATACTDTQSTTSTHGNTFYPNPSPWRQHHLYFDEASKARHMQKPPKQNKSFQIQPWLYFMIFLFKTTVMNYIQSSLLQGIFASSSYHGSSVSYMGWPKVQMHRCTSHLISC